MTERQRYLTCALLEIYQDMGGTPLRQDAAEKHLALKTDPKATPSEARERITWCEAKGHLTSVRTDSGLLHTITPSGQTWLQINA